MSNLDSILEDYRPAIAPAEAEYDRSVALAKEVYIKAIELAEKTITEAIEKEIEVYKQKWLKSNGVEPVVRKRAYE